MNETQLVNAFSKLPPLKEASIFFNFRHALREHISSTEITLAKLWINIYANIDFYDFKYKLKNSLGSFEKLVLIGNDYGSLIEDLENASIGSKFISITIPELILMQMYYLESIGSKANVTWIDIEKEGVISIEDVDLLIAISSFCNNKILTKIIGEIVPNHLIVEYL